MSPPFPSPTIAPPPEPPLELPFEVAIASIIGREHQRLGKNNQDAAWVQRGDRAWVAVVCDGCGSAPHSEVGASLGARWVAQAVGDRLTEDPARLNQPDFWPDVTQAVLGQLDRLIGSLGGDPVAALRDYALFTVVGAAVTQETTAIFACGDGAIALNGEDIPLGPFPGNAPPYLAYGLLGPPVEGVASPPLGLSVVRSLPTEDVQSLLLATDGWLDVPTDHALRDFAESDRLFANPDNLRRALALLNQERNHIDWQRQQIERSAGLLGDDTTVIMLRKVRR